MVYLIQTNLIATIIKLKRIMTQIILFLTFRYQNKFNKTKLQIQAHKTKQLIRAHKTKQLILAHKINKLI